jgi:glycosyltransferase involved in cell wall biosynthesis
MDLVSVIIPTFNRFQYLLNTIKSIQAQTYKAVEIIVVNDCSTEKAYYENDWTGIKIIHLEKNSKEIFGFACGGHVRNKGIKQATGKYIAFCDDDDIWFPSKLELQINAMNRTGVKMSSTDGFIGKGFYNPFLSYKRYIGEHFFELLQHIHRMKGSNFLENGFPEIWTEAFLSIHNCMITSSVVIEKIVLEKINNMKCVPNGKEDYDCWLRAMKYTNSVYVNEVCFYYDNGHGVGRNY